MNIERPTVEQQSIAQRAARHAALSDVARLHVVDALALGDRSPSELQASIGLPSNLMAHHLKVLEEAGIVARRRSEGDRRRTYLTLTGPADAEQPEHHLAAGRVLFVCTANSARSQLAAGLWARASDVPTASAGTNPAPSVAAGAVAVAERHHLPLRLDGPQHFAAVAAAGDLVVAVCDNAYEELGDVVTIHWSIPDPVARGGRSAFDEAYAELDRRIATLAPRLVAA